MATILSETKSTGKDPYAYYTVNATASDRTVSTVKVKVDVTSRLSSSGAFLGTGSTMGLIGYITLNGKEHSITLKTTSQSWSGTTKHTASGTFTVEDLEGSQSQLTNIKFRVSRTGSAAGNYSQGAAMSSKNCSNLQIGVGHTEPTNVTYVMTEKNQKLIDAGVSDDLMVENLSIKEFLFSYTLHDGASFKRCRIWNMASAVYGSDENPFSINLKNQPFPGKYDGKILLFGDVVDSLEGYGASSKTYYDYIPYVNISLNETNTITKRSGQTTGKVKLNVSGTFYKGDIGNVNQTDYKPAVKYKFWKLGDTEPNTFDNTIPSENITVTNSVFTITDYQIGSSDETATNYFNPDYAYRVKVYVEDNFTNYTSQEKSIPVGEATWTEYKDRVDFKRITRKGNDIIAPRIGDVVITSTNVNPATDYGGTWELIDKEFKSQYRYFNVSNTTYITKNNASDGDFRIFYNSHSLHVDGTLKVSTALSDTAVNIATLKFPTLGLSLESSYFFVGWSDGGNALAMLQMTSAGIIQCVDVVGKSSSATIASGQTIYFEFAINARYTNMNDSECDKFYWKKTA